MDQLSAAELVAALESPNGWQRDTAQRLLVMAQDNSVVGDLELLVTENLQPLARLHALCTLDGLNALTRKIVETALQDAHPGVRRQAVRLTPAAKVPLASLVTMTKDPNAKVRLQLACVAGEFREALAGQILGELLLSDTDPYLRAAVISSLNSENIMEVIDRFSVIVQQDAATHDAGVTDIPGFSASDRDELTSILFGQVAAIADDDDIIRSILMTCDESGRRLHSWQLMSLANMLDRLNARRWSVSDHMKPEEQSQVTEAIRIARQVAADSSAEQVLRIAAIPLLLRGSESGEDRAVLQSLLAPQVPVSVQEATIRHLGLQSDESVADILLTGWSSHSPLLRTQILTVLSSRVEWVIRLVAQLESGSVAAAEIDASMRQRLLTTRDTAIRGRLEKVFTSETSADRKAVMESFQPALKLTGDAARGALLFGKKCANCHKQGGIGHEVGPNLASLTTRTPESLFTAILDPSAAVEARYLNFVVATTSGRSVIGLLSTETGSSITLLAAEGKTESILRADIEELRSTGKSLMPDGVEKDLTQQDIADVIEYVRTLQK